MQILDGILWLAQWGALATAFTAFVGNAIAHSYNSIVYGYAYTCSRPLLIRARWIMVAVGLALIFATARHFVDV